MVGERDAQAAISVFVCKKDKDIENFLIYKAIEYEKLGKSRTFLIIDEDQVEFQVLAYYTIALQVLNIPYGVISNGQRKKLDGLSAKIHGNLITSFSAILIGQLGKNDMYADAINGPMILDYCLATILEGQTKLAGRIIMLECKNQPKLIELYENYQFGLVDKDYEEGELLQMIRILTPDEIIND